MKKLGLMIVAVIAIFLFANGAEARWYSPQMKRFISEDPMGYAAGDMNFYRYVNNNPLNFVDPMGLSTIFIEIIHDTETANSTTGIFKVNLAEFGYSLELPWRENKVNESRIPSGRYYGRVAESPKRGYDVVWIDGVPNRSSIEIHIGNFPSDVTGCAAVGMSRGDDFVGNSTEAFNRLMSSLRFMKNWDTILGEQTNIIIDVIDRFN